MFLPGLALILYWWDVLVGAVIYSFNFCGDFYVVSVGVSVLNYFAVGVVFFLIYLFLELAGRIFIIAVW